MREPLPLATIHDAVLEFLRGRTDAVLFGAQAVNAYVDESRMTQEVDLLSLRARDVAGEIRDFLQKIFMWPWACGKLPTAKVFAYIMPPCQKIGNWLMCVRLRCFRRSTPSTMCWLPCRRS